MPDPSMEIKAKLSSGQSFERENQNLNSFLNFLQSMGVEIEDIESVKRTDV